MTATSMITSLAASVVFKEKSLHPYTQSCENLDLSKPLCRTLAVGAEVKKNQKHIVLFRT